MKKILLMALAAITIFACSKEDDMTINNETKTVKLSIKAGALTRAEGQPLANGTKTTIHSLLVYFLDAADGNVVSGSKPIIGADLTTITTGGLEIQGVNSSARYVYVVANYAENGVDLTGTTNLSIIKSKTALMSNTNTADWSKALLSNSDATNNGLISAVVNNKASASVEIMPDLARIEIAALNAKSPGAVTSPDVALTQFDLKGVYLNGYYSGFNVGGAPFGTTAALAQNAADLTAVPAWAKDVYATKLTGATTYTATSSSTIPGDVWTYMLPAGNAPRIIFDIDNVKYGTDIPANTDKFITVKSFVTADANSTSIPTFLRGKVYKVTAVNFSAKDLHDNPNAQDINVTVTVDVLGWQGIDVNPEI